MFLNKFHKFDTTSLSKKQYKNEVKKNPNKLVYLNFYVT